jgi:hypothetical protein
LVSRRKLRSGRAAEAIKNIQDKPGLIARDMRKRFDEDRHGFPVPGAG